MSKRINNQMPEKEDYFNKILQEKDPEHVLVTNFPLSENKLNYLLENINCNELQIKLFVLKKLLLLLKSLPDEMKDEYIVEDKYLHEIFNTLLTEDDEQIQVLYKLMNSFYRQTYY